MRGARAAGCDGGVNLDCHSEAARGLRRYVRLIADELHPQVERTAAHWVHPVRATVALTGRLHWFPGRPLALTWDEHYGWAMVLAACSTGGLTVLRYLGSDLVPAPETVATFSRKLFADQFAGQYDPPAPDTARNVTARLAAYARPCRARRRGKHPVHLYGVVTSHSTPA
jgi:hypothetical protein